MFITCWMRDYLNQRRRLHAARRMRAHPRPKTHEKPSEGARRFRLPSIIFETDGDFCEESRDAPSLSRLTNRGARTHTHTHIEDVHTPSLSPRRQDTNHINWFLGETENPKEWGSVKSKAVKVHRIRKRIYDRKLSVYQIKHRLSGRL